MKYTLTREIARIEAERDRIHDEMLKLPEGAWNAELYAAQQALAWALNPDAARSPYDMIMGIPRAAEDCQGGPRPPSS